MKLKKEDRAKLAKALCGVLVWGAVVIGAGSAIGKTPVSHPTTVKSAAETRQAIQDGRGSEESKAQKLHELNLQAVIKGMKKSENVLGIADWEKPISKARDGIPALQVYFPQGQDIKGWNESFVLRSFVNITIPNPYPLVFEVYSDWLRTQLPDIQLTTTQDSTGIYFSGASKAENLFITGKVYSGAVKEAIHISQYAIKGTDNEQQEKVSQWKANFSKIKQ